MNNPKVGDRVRFSYCGQTGSISGVIIKVIPKKLSTGGEEYFCKIRWDNGYVGRMEDRVLEKMD